MSVNLDWGNPPPRNLLEKLGFRDEDRKAPVHDLACHYLAQPPIAQKLLAAIAPPKTAAIVDLEARQELLLSKGENQYKTVVGFIDVMLTGRADLGMYLCSRSGEPVTAECDGVPWKEGECDRYYQCQGKCKHPQAHREKPRKDRHDRYRATEGLSLGIEVKATERSVPDAIRQIEVYRAHAAGPWMLVTIWQPTALEMDALASSKILHRQLGPEFDVFCVEHCSVPGRTETI